MHPQVRATDPKAKCPICFMDLVPLDEGDTDEPAQRLVLSARAAQMAELQTDTVRRHSARKTLRLVGRVDFDETRLKHVTAWVGGRLDRLYINYTGIPVQAGQPMAEIYSPQLIAAHQELLQARGRPQLAEAARQRLLRWGILPDQIEAMMTASQPSRHLTVHSPVGGVVISKHVNEGLYVEQGRPLFSIADLSRVWLLLSAYESDVQWLRYGQTVEFEVDALPGETFQGLISFIDPILRESSRTVPVRVTVDNASGRLKPGLFARALVRIEVDEQGRPRVSHLKGKWVSPLHPEIIKDGPGTCDVCGIPLIPADVPETGTGDPLLVPDTAPLWTGTRSVVYRAVPGKPSTYEGVTVTLGPRLDEGYLVRDGLNEGDEVVVNGAFKIDAELQIRARPSMMAPPVRPDQPAEVPAHTDVQGSGGSGKSPSRRSLPPAYREFYVELVQSALSVSFALAADDQDVAQAAAETGLAALAKVPTAGLPEADRHPWQMLREDFRKGFSHIKNAADLQASRAGLRHLTGVLDRAFASFGNPLPKPVLQMFCPMAFNNQGATWYQRPGTLANPYFGEAMLRCGEQRAEVAPDR